MGIFDKLFGYKKQSNFEALEKELKEEYNVMKNISLDKCQKYEDADQYKFVENGIYLDLNDEDDSKYRMTVTYELESDENNNQFPLEDILNEYYLYVSDFLESENDCNPNIFKIELAGELSDIQKAQNIIGKKVYNKDVLDGNEIRVSLVIE